MMWWKSRLALAWCCWRGSSGVERRRLGFQGAARESSGTPGLWWGSPRQQTLTTVCLSGIDAKDRETKKKNRGVGGGNPQPCENSSPGRLKFVYTDGVQESFDATGVNNASPSRVARWTVGTPIGSQMVTWKMGLSEPHLRIRLCTLPPSLPPAIWNETAKHMSTKWAAVSYHRRKCSAALPIAEHWEEEEHRWQTLLCYTGEERPPASSRLH